MTRCISESAYLPVFLKTMLVDNGMIYVIKCKADDGSMTTGDVIAKSRQHAQERCDHRGYNEVVVGPREYVS